MCLGCTAVYFEQHLRKNPLKALWFVGGRPKNVFELLLWPRSLFRLLINLVRSRLEYQGYYSITLNTYCLIWWSKIMSGTGYYIPERNDSYMYKNKREAWLDHYRAMTGYYYKTHPRLHERTK